MKSFLICLSFLLLFTQPIRAQTGRDVVVTIAPLHSLVQSVMGDTGEATLLVQGYQSPHGYQLKPSQIRLLNKSAIVFYIGNRFESFLERSFDTMPSHIRRVSLFNSDGVKILKIRGGGAWEAHDHASHEEHEDHENHEDHDEEHHKNHHDAHHGKHDEDNHEADHDEHEEDHEKPHGREADQHIWLNPLNAIAMVKTIAKELAETYPENRRIYKDNAVQTITAITAADQDFAAKLAAVRQRPYIVFHDGYQYFEQRYGLSGVGSVLLEPDESPSIARIQDIRTKIAQVNAVCIFKEPQFSDKIVRTVVEDTAVKTGILDPIGSDLAPGSDLYVKMMAQMAENTLACLQE